MKTPKLSRAKKRLGPIRKSGVDSPAAHPSPDAILHAISTVIQEAEGQLQIARRLIREWAVVLGASKQRRPS